MLFCSPSEVNEIWGLVAKATAQNELGIAAKVNPRSQFDDFRKDRVICIYTADFQDKSDVGRVLQQLKRLKLVGPGLPTMYYKPGESTSRGNCKTMPPPHHADDEQISLPTLVFRMETPGASLLRSTVRNHFSNGFSGCLAQPKIPSTLGI